MSKNIKSIIILFLFLSLFIIFLVRREKNYRKYKYHFFGTFDTIVETVVCARNDMEAEKYNNYIEKKFIELHKLFDKYHSYDGINNVYTINKNAGKSPVRVSDELFNLIETSIELNKIYSNKVDISLGEVLKVWKNYRNINLEEGANKLPTYNELEKANNYTGLENIQLNDLENSVYISNKNTSIDVGSIAKGYATEIIAKELISLGCKSAIINAGGNTRVIGKPQDGVRMKWGIGIRNPDYILGPGGNDVPSIIETVYVTDLSVVTSGSYERYFEVDGKNYNHLIDPETLFPGNFYKSVTIICEDSGMADFFSTAIFLLPLDEGIKLLNIVGNTECMWITNENKIIKSAGFDKYLDHYK